MRKALGVLACVALMAAAAPCAAQDAHEAQMIKHYTKQVGSSDEDLRADAAWQLGDYKSPEAVGALVKALNDRSARVRANAAAGLYRIGGPVAEPAQTALRTALKDPDGMVRVNAADALSEL